MQSQSLLIESLIGLTAEHPYARKRLVGVDVNFGRETLQTLARRTGGWIGWEAVNVRTIADELAFVSLSQNEERIASDIEVAALVNEALDAGINAHEVTGQFAELAKGLGFRRALRDSLLDARTGGVTGAQLRDIAAGNSSSAAVASVLSRYESLLASRKLADPARVLRVALDSFSTEAPFVLDGIIALAPTLSTRGLTGELLARLIAHGASVLRVDTPRDIAPPSMVLGTSEEALEAKCCLLALVSGSAAPDPANSRLDRSLAQVDMFVAATPAEEVREVCRRVMADGLSWNDVEIVATDPDTYGIALDALCTRLDVGITMLKGIPFSRTRIGRALDRWFMWIADGLPADVLRQALEAGEIGLEGAAYSSSRLASEVRRLSIGWGRARYDAALARLTSGASVAGMEQREETAEEFADRRAKRVAVHAEVARLLGAVLAATPPVPERGNDTPVRATVHDLARCTLAYLDLVTPHGQAEQLSMARLRDRLAELAVVTQPVVGFTSALAALRESLSDLRAWPYVTSDSKPWSTSGGMIHLTDLQHAGASGRPRTFVVGLDADRTRGGVLQDPVLSDRVRGAVGSAMATSTERHESAAWRTGVALAGLRGRVTLSYAMNASLDGREAGPSPQLLQAWRLIANDATQSFADMRKAFVPPACAVPASNSGMLDARDVWFGNLTDGALVLDGSTQTREAFAPLAAGLDAIDMLQSATASGYHGLVPNAGALLDPLAHPDKEISPSSLEQLGACPMAWFYKYGLKLRDPGDPEYDTERWLDAMQRGSLLHGVYESFVRDYLGRQAEILESAADTHLQRIVDDALKAWKAEVPPPSEMIYASEAAQIVHDTRLFLQLERDAHRASPGIAWTTVELPFGRQYDGSASNAAGTFSLADGRTLRVQGRADRIDTLPDGRLRVVDYKTGRATSHMKSAAAMDFAGGRQLQPALYAAAVETVTGTPVGSFEYRFPTERGESEIVTYDAAELAGAPSLIGSLLSHVARGEFVSTNDSMDCRYCDYSGICRSKQTQFDTSTPRAEWATTHGATLSLYQSMRDRRGQDTDMTSSAADATEVA